MTEQKNNRMIIFMINCRSLVIITSERRQNMNRTISLFIAMSLDGYVADQQRNGYMRVF